MSKCTLHISEPCTYECVKFVVYERDKEGFATDGKFEVCPYFEGNIEAKLQGHDETPLGLPKQRLVPSNAKHTEGSE